MRCDHARVGATNKTANRTKPTNTHKHTQTRKNTHKHARTNTHNKVVGWFVRRLVSGDREPPSSSDEPERAANTQICSQAGRRVRFFVFLGWFGSGLAFCLGLGIASPCHRDRAALFVESFSGRQLDGFVVIGGNRGVCLHQLVCASVHVCVCLCRERSRCRGQDPLVEEVGIERLSR